MKNYAISPAQTPSLGSTSSRFLLLKPLLFPLLEVRKDLAVLQVLQVVRYTLQPEDYDEL